MKKTKKREVVVNGNKVVVKNLVTTINGEEFEHGTFTIDFTGVPRETLLKWATNDRLIYWQAAWRKSSIKEVIEFCGQKLSAQKSNTPREMTESEKLERQIARASARLAELKNQQPKTDETDETETDDEEIVIE